jgi:hypothetical protein
MKKNILFLLIVFLASSFAWAQTNKLVGSNSKANGPVATWDKITHDFGDIPKDVPVTVSFKITNTGNAPLIISDVKPSCGCTTPSYTKDPILPGKSGVVKAQYNAAAPGPFNKTITVITNSSEPNKVLTIKGQVVEGGSN